MGEVVFITMNEKNKKTYFLNQTNGLLTAGTIDNFNTMTIGWCHYGYVFSVETIIVYVRKSRYTFDFISKNDYFTVSFYNDEYKKDLNYLGTKSGRDEDKVAKTSLTPVKYFDSVSFKEAEATFYLKKIYQGEIFEDQLLSPLKEKYFIEDDNHYLFIGQVIEK